MLQSLLNTFYRYPRSQWKTWQKFGGYFAYKQVFEDEKQMQKASETIAVQKPENDLQELKVCFLTGKKFWHQTVFCAYSLQKHSPNPIHFTFYDDGSLHEIINLKQQVPNSKVVTSQEIEQNLIENLPIEKYPYLHHKREVYKHIRKLTDVYTDKNSEWKLMLDSDMLFWKTPTQMLEWLKNPNKPFYILDCETAYGYDLEVMGKLSNSNIKPKINVGALGLCKNYVDFDKLEYWAKTLEQNHGTSYYLEQALSAMLIGNKDPEIGKAEDYIVYPTENQVKSQTGVLQHYVDVSKKWYFKDAWKKIL